MQCYSWNIAFQRTYLEAIVSQPLQLFLQKSRSHFPYPSKKTDGRLANILDH